MFMDKVLAMLENRNLSIIVGIVSGIVWVIIVILCIKGN